MPPISQFSLDRPVGVARPDFAKYKAKNNQVGEAIDLNLAAKKPDAPAPAPTPIVDNPFFSQLNSNAKSF